MSLHSTGSRPVRGAASPGARSPGPHFRPASLSGGAGFQGPRDRPGSASGPQGPRDRLTSGVGPQGPQDRITSGAGQAPQDRFTPGVDPQEGLGQDESPLLEGMRQTYQPVLLAQGPSTRDRTQGVIDVASPATSLPQFPGNPSMPYFPGGYNPTDPTAPAGLINRVWEPVNNRLGAAFNPHAQQDAEMVRHLLDRARRDMPNAKYMAREQALNYLRQRYGNLGERRLNQLLDNLATQTSNTGLFGRERNWIYADDIQQFLTNRRY